LRAFYKPFCSISICNKFDVQKTFDNFFVIFLSFPKGAKNAQKMMKNASMSIFSSFPANK